MMEHRPRLYLDIETRPDARDGAYERALERVKAPANYKDPAKIAAYVHAQAEDAYARTSLDGAYGEVLCIGWAIDDGPVTVTHDDDERELLAAFWAELDAALPDLVDPIWVGHNIRDFDLRFLWQRCVVRGVLPSRRIPYDASVYDTILLDTMLLWTGSPRERVSLNTILQALDIPAPDVGGGDVWPMLQAGELQKILDYCAYDVSTVRVAAQRMLRTRVP